MIACYVFWGWHEIARDEFDFSGDRDLAYFLSLCAERELLVLLRLGPYCCGEWNYGGFPAYLRDEPGIVFRTWNRPYMLRVEKYFTRLFAEFGKHLSTRGGPVVMVQVENEYANIAKRYGEEGHRYILWIAELARRLGVDVPLLMCETGTSDIPGVLTTVNGFSISSERTAHQQQSQPGNPVFWSELWPAWYNTWGYQTHHRDARAIAMAILDFVARGGSGWNYYMWHGGTNFGRTAMYLQTTSYDFDGPLDEFGKVTRKGKYLSILHEVLSSVAEVILNGERSTDGATVTWTLGGQVIKLERNPADLSGWLSNHEDKVLFHTHEDYQKVSSKFVDAAWRELPALADWRSWREPMPDQRSDAPTVSTHPLEQLLLTRDQSDYCWYSAWIEVLEDGQQTIQLDYAGDMLSLFLDGQPVARSQPPFLENRGPTLQSASPEVGVEVNILESQRGKYDQLFSFSAGKGRHRLDILAVSLGLIKGDWMISGPMQTERKGIWGNVTHNGRLVLDWEMRPRLVGEQRRIDANLETVQWNEMDTGACTWHQTSFQLQADLLQSDTDFRIDAVGLGKGMLFVNGLALGRHWLIDAHGYGADEGWHSAQSAGLNLGPEGEPTQRYYHLPLEWLQMNNRMVIFEEFENRGPMNIRIQMRPAL